VFIFNIPCIYELLKKAGPGSNILINTSVLGKHPSRVAGVYAMTKAALDNMVIWLAKELMDDGIRVNGIAPGLIKTEMSGPFWKNRVHKLPKNSAADPSEIAAVAATICSADGSFMNGETYQVNGGYPKL
jgi:NAD(P)-dependent dehydrogenase (short-subunit alcohol dehydrogenase family)